MVSRQLTNPNAAWVTMDRIRKYAAEFYGTKTLMFDKALAESVLEMNTGNRRLNRRKIEQLARQMSSGEFENTGEPVIISVEGIINDGQHRLHALVEADAVVDMDVRFGIPRAAFSKTDTGTSRTSGDVLTIKGVSGGGQVASAVRLLVLYKRGLPGSVREFVSNDEIATAFDSWKTITDVVGEVNAHAFPKAIRSTPLYSTAYLASRSPAKSKLSAWLEAVATGLDIGRDSPAYHLREKLLRGTDAAIGTREGLLERFALMIKSWNGFVKDESATRKDFSVDECRPSRGGLPDGDRRPFVEMRRTEQGPPAVRYRPP